jgi:hypothetical protein
VKLKLIQDVSVLLWWRKLRHRMHNPSRLLVTTPTRSAKTQAKCECKGRSGVAYLCQRGRDTQAPAVLRPQIVR